MNLWEVQPAIVALLQADPRFAGVPVIADDGTYPKTPGREAALAGAGLVLIVWEIESDGLVDASRTGLAAHEVYTPVVIEENPTICRAATGANIPAEKALQWVLEDISGKPGGPRHFVAMDPPFKNFGKVNGVRRMVVNLSLQTFIQPA